GPDAGLPKTPADRQRPQRCLDHSTTEVDVWQEEEIPCARHAAHAPETLPGYSWDMPSREALPGATGRSCCSVSCQRWRNERAATALKSRDCVQPENGAGSLESQPWWANGFWARAARAMADWYSRGRCMIQAQTMNRARSIQGASWRSTSCRRRFSSRCGMLIFTGQASRQAPQSVLARGRCCAVSRPVNIGVSTAPIGPG